MPRYASLMRKFTREEITKFLTSSRVVLKQAGLVVRAAPAQKEWGRIVVIVPRRFGNSPQRHEFKRQVRAIFYENKLFEHGFDVAIFAYKQLQGIPFVVLQTTLTNLYTPNSPLYTEKTESVLSQEIS